MSKVIHTPTAFIKVKVTANHRDLAATVAVFTKLEDSSVPAEQTGINPGVSVDLPVRPGKYHVFASLGGIRSASELVTAQDGATTEEIEFVFGK